MSERDRTRDAFEALRRDVQPLVRRPGVEATRRTVRRRHARNTIVASLAVILVSAGLFFLTARFGEQPEPIGPTPTPSVSAQAFAEPAPSESAAAAAAAQPAACTSDPVGVFAGSLYPQVAIRIRYKDAATGAQLPMCSGVRLRVLWATYKRDNATGVLSLVGSGPVFVDNNSPQQTVRAEVTPDCTDTYFTLADVPIPAALDFNAIQTLDQPGGPFWDYRHNKSGLAHSDGCYRP